MQGKEPRLRGSAFCDSMKTTDLLSYAVFAALSFFFSQDSKAVSTT